MRYNSLLSDAQIAKLLGLKLVGSPLEDLPATVEIRGFRGNFESELEERLKEGYKQVLDVVKGVAVNTVRNDIIGSIGDRALKTRLYLDDPKVEIEEKVDAVKFYINMGGYVGKDGRGKATNHDIGYLSRLFVDPTTISFDHVDGLGIDRRGDVQVKRLDQPAQLAGKSLDSNHHFQVTYVAEIPKARLPEVYQKHMPAIR